MLSMLVFRYGCWRRAFEGANLLLAPGGSTYVLIEHFWCYPSFCECLWGHAFEGSPG